MKKSNKKYFITTLVLVIILVLIMIYKYYILNMIIQINTNNSNCSITIISNDVEVEKYLIFNDIVYDINVEKYDKAIWKNNNESYEIQLKNKTKKRINNDETYRLFPEMNNNINNVFLLKILNNTDYYTIEYDNKINKMTYYYDKKSFKLLKCIYEQETYYRDELFEDKKTFYFDYNTVTESDVNIDKYVLIEE